jgi:hypothetical protein
MELRTSGAGSAQDGDRRMFPVSDWKVVARSPRLLLIRKDCEKTQDEHQAAQ